MNYYFIKTVINNLCRPVKILNNEELTIAQFVERALLAHELQAIEINSSDFAIHDGDNMPIDDFGMLSQWKSDSSFKVIIDLKVSRKNIEIVAESLKNFLNKKGADNICDEHNIMGFLSPTMRRKLIKMLVLFIDEEYHGQQTNENITTVCQATIVLFESLKVSVSKIGGIDLLYDSERNSGFLLNALQYNARKKKRKALEKLSDDEEPLTDETKEETLMFFKRWVLPKERKEVEKRMVETKVFRRDLVLNKFEKYRECWKFYFVLPELILFDFKLMFENAKDGGLTEMWPSICDVPYKQFGIRIEKEIYPVMRKNDDIFKMFMFLKLLPSPRYSFKKAVNSFLVYTEDPNTDPVHIRNKSLKNPYIIAAFSVVSKNAAFYIDIQDHIICLPPKFTFLQTVDMFIKLHYVFNFEYGKEFSKAMYFFEYVLYDILSSKRFMTTSMTEVANAIFEKKMVDINGNISTNKEAESAQTAISID